MKKNLLTHFVWAFIAVAAFVLGSEFFSADNEKVTLGEQAESSAPHAPTRDQLQPSPRQNQINAPSITSSSKKENPRQRQLQVPQQSRTKSSFQRRKAR